MADFTYQITEHLGTLSKLTNGWSKEVNIIADPVASRTSLDIREWPYGKKRMGRGISLNYEETQMLISLLLSNTRLLETLEREESYVNTETIKIHTGGSDTRTES